MTKMHNPRRSGFRRLLAAAAVVALWSVPTFALTPTFSSGSASYIHDPGGPLGASTSGALPLQNTGSPSNTLNPDTITFQSPSGKTNAKAGIGRTQSSTVAKVVFPSGMGVDQTDPNHVENGSALRVDFSSTWNITGAGSFGPSVSGVFSVPFAASIGAGGSAQVDIEVHWDAIVNGVNMPDVRSPYVVSNPYGPGSVITAFTAPASPFSPSSFTDHASTDQIKVYGFVQIRVNNDDAPSATEFPYQTSQLFPGAEQDPAFKDIFAIEPHAGFEVTPEPSAAALLAVGGLLALRRRRLN
jgi:MYXO-CTERM domain-containing protein